MAHRSEGIDMTNSGLILVGIIAGGGAGLLAGLIGIGGGIVIVPVIYVPFVVLIIVAFCSAFLQRSRGAWARSWKSDGVFNLNFQFSPETVFAETTRKKTAATTIGTPDPSVDRDVDPYTGRGKCTYRWTGHQAIYRDAGLGASRPKSG
jgi:hypothetical protein